MIVRYVAHKDIKRYEKAGWILKNRLTGQYAGQFSVLMIKLTSPEEFEIWDEKECRTTEQIGSITPHITHREAKLSASTTYATAWAMKHSCPTAKAQLKNTFIGGALRQVSKTWKKLSGI
jgi:hypothetical protein